MAEQVKVTTETVETPPVETATPETAEQVKTEIKAETAEQAAEQASQAAEQVEQTAEQVEEQTKKAEQAAEKAEQVTYLSESALKGLQETINLAVTRIEQIATISKETAATVENLAVELRATLDLNQEQIGTMDAAAQAVVTATAALVTLHKVQTDKK